MARPGQGPGHGSGRPRAHPGGEAPHQLAVARRLLVEPGAGPAEDRRPQHRPHGPRPRRARQHVRQGLPLVVLFALVIGDHPRVAPAHGALDGGVVLGPGDGGLGQQEEAADHEDHAPAEPAVAVVVQGHPEAPRVPPEAGEEAVPHRRRQQGQPHGAAHVGEQAQLQGRGEARVQGDHDGAGGEPQGADEDGDPDQERSPELEEKSAPGHQLQQSRGPLAHQGGQGQGHVVELEGVPDGGAVLGPDRVGLEQRRGPVDDGDLGHEAEGGHRPGAVAALVGPVLPGLSHGGVDRGARPEGQEHRPEQEHPEEHVAGVEDGGVPVLQRQQQQPAQHREQPGAVADEQAEGAEGGDGEEQELHLRPAADHVQGDGPGRGAGGDAVEQVDARQHAGVGVEHADVSGSRRQVDEEDHAEEDAEQRQGPQVEAEALRPAAEPPAEPGAGGSRG